MNWHGKTPTKDEWRDILEKHAKWLRSEPGGERADLQRADLQGADLQGADLQGADLQGADLRRADLQRADLRRADLQRADLQGAYLQGADLQGADLWGAYLQGADLQGADLQGADLEGADLEGADLQGAYLQRADLQGAYLEGADLQGADLEGADLQGAYLEGAKNAELPMARTRILPEGDLIGWKKCRNGVIVQLLIPQKARRSHAFGRKCRAEAVVVMAVFPPDQKAESIHTSGFFYGKGGVVTPDWWDEDWTKECGGGIHFYISRAEAEAHQSGGRRR
jgi:hypothetical protein